ncbi:MAG: ABC transporter permease [Prevotella sp.]|nr:ABC transporter permease [Prevotella sp.]
MCMKQKKRELMMQELGKYSLDMSKLIFGGVILAGIMNLGVEAIYLFGVGGTLVAFFAVIGFVFYSKSR